MNRDVLIPRTETELLVEAGLDLLDASPCARAVGHRNRQRGHCPGPGRRAAGAVCGRHDCSSAALQVAAQNAQRLQLADRVRLCRTDGAAGLDLRGAVVLPLSPIFPQSC